METEKFYKDFGQKLAKLRVSKGLTQAELAHKIHLSRASVANLERGEQRLYIHQLVQISRALKIDDADRLLPRLAPLGGDEDLTISGDNLSAAQERELRRLIGSIAATSRSSASR